MMAKVELTWRYLILLVGVVMDLTPAMVILAPLMVPIVETVGVDPVYFGVLMSFVLGIGLITPPVGTVLYVGCGIGGVKMEELVRSMVPFYVALLAVLLIVFPSLILWLPYASGAGLEARAEERTARPPWSPLPSDLL